MKTLVIDALVGIGFPSQQLALQCEMAGLARQDGNQFGAGVGDQVGGVCEASEIILLEDHGLFSFGS